MREYVEIGPAPSDEECVQVGTENYSTLARQECQRFINLLRQTFGNEPEGAKLAIKAFPHDFGSYYEVVCYYDDNHPASIEYAYTIENDAPAKWS